MRTAEERAKRREAKFRRENPGKPYLGYKRSDETRANISRATSGENSPRYGKPAPNRGVSPSDATKAKMSEAHSGKPSHKKGKPGPPSPNKGKHPSREVCILMSMAHQGITNRSDYHGHASEKGDRCWKWRDPVLKIRKRVRAFFCNKCIKCGKTKEENGCHLSVNHVGNNRQACCAENPNGWLFVPLCISCHTKSSGMNQKAADVEYTNQINREYGGKCYYTLEEYDQLVKEGKLKTEDYGRRDGR